jgi:tetratricopeptide (TPR) repeat protein
VAEGRFATIRARQLADSAAELLDTDRDQATACYQQAVRLDPSLEAAWFDLGLLHKAAGRWQQAFECSLRAAELVGEEAGEPAWWNLGIAATAVRRWDTARRAWRAFGYDIPEGDGPIEMNFGAGLVRLNPHDKGEVVWGRRLDPARMRLTSIPFPTSGYHWADVVLHDGEPNGYRVHDGQKWAVFDQVSRFESSGVPTVEARLRVDSTADVDELLERLAQASYAAEDWTRSIRMVCRHHSEGVVRHQDDDPDLDAEPDHLVAIAGRLHEVRSVVEAWEDGAGRRCLDLYADRDDEDYDDDEDEDYEDEDYDDYD